QHQCGDAEGHIHARPLKRRRRPDRSDYPGHPAERLREVPTADHRFRIEHAQILRYQDIPRFAELGVIPSMQGSHPSSDMYCVPHRIGWSRAQGSYAWRSLLNTGVVIPNGSDFPVEAVNPLISFRAFFTRTDE